MLIYQYYKIKNINSECVGTWKSQETNHVSWQPLAYLQMAINFSDQYILER